MLQRITIENKIGEIVALPPYNIKARVVEVSNVSCEECYYQDQEYLCTGYRCDGVLGECCLMRRKDHKNIIYKPLSAEEEEI